MKILHFSSERTARTEDCSHNAWSRTVRKLGHRTWSSCSIWRLKSSDLWPLCRRLTVVIWPHVQRPHAPSRRVDISSSSESRFLIEFYRGPYGGWVSLGPVAAPVRHDRAGRRGPLHSRVISQKAIFWSFDAFPFHVYLSLVSLWICIFIGSKLRFSCPAVSCLCPFAILGVVI